MSAATERLPYSIAGRQLPPLLAWALETGLWQAPASRLRVLMLEQIYARRVELDGHRELRDLLVIATIEDREIALDYAHADRQSSCAAPQVVERSPGAAARVVAEGFAEWAAGHWPEDAGDAAREAPLFGRREVPLRTAPHLWMPGVDPD